jgi:hypothetical protein
MSENALRIALPKLFLWSEPGRFQEYPEALSKAQAGRSYTRVEVERELFDIAPTMAFKGGALRGRRTDGIINAQGLERSGARYRINGIDLLRKTRTGIMPTSVGLEIGSLYRQAPDGDEWPRALARQILLRELRTRLLVGLLLQGAELEIDFTGATPTGNVAVVLVQGNRIAIAQRECIEFNEILSQHAELALGPCWRADLASVGIDGEVHFEGVQGDAPSTNDLPNALKKSLAVLFHVGAFDGDGGRWSMNVERLAEVLGTEVANSFGVDAAPRSAKHSDDDVFARALAETTDNDGFVVVSRLADRFGELLAVPMLERALVLDSFVRSAMYHERLRVLERHSESRRVRIEFHKGTSPEVSTAAALPSIGLGKENSGDEQ